MTSAPPGPPARGRQVAVTIDDLPVISVVHRELDVHRRITEQLLSGLRAHRIPAIGFVNERNLHSQGVLIKGRVELLRAWLDAGMELGNHGYGHLDLHQVPAAEFEADVLRGETFTRELMAGRGLAPRYFRHPYLHTGTRLEDKRHVEGFLAEHRYQVAPVTVYTEDYMFAAALDRQRERGNQEGAREVAEAYVPYVERQFAYYEQLSQRLLGYELPQILVIHANTINAERIDEMARMIEGRGYTFVTLEQALADEAYAVEDPYIRAHGVSWLQRWAFNRGLGQAFLDGEPTTPAFVRRRAEVARVDQIRRAMNRRSQAAAVGLRSVIKAGARAVGLMPPKKRKAAR